MSFSLCQNCNRYMCKCNYIRNKLLNNIQVDGSRSSSFYSSVESIHTTCTDTICSTESPESYKCSNCNAEFKNKQTLNLHQKTSEKCSKHDEDSNCNKVCSSCNKAFSSKQMKKYHESKCVDKKISEITDICEKKLKDMHNHYEKLLQNNNITI